MHDLMPQDFEVHQDIINAARTQASLFGFQEMATPLVESREVFDRSVATSDIVTKEMFEVKSRSGEDPDSTMVLRPEGTAPVMRALISQGLTQSLPQRLFYAGPMFRYDRPQKGRLRQFHQVGMECVGLSDPWADVEVLACAEGFLNALTLTCPVTLHINTLGDLETRTAFRERLLSYLSPYRGDLSPDSQVRLETNPLRILDSKNLSDQKILEGAPSLSGCLTPSASAFFERVCEGLGLLGIPYTVTPQLVRGLDYYVHTAFEFRAEEGLGAAQATVLGGGRYDGLTALLGGPSLPGIGWAAGVERLALLRPPRPSVSMPLALLPHQDGDIGWALKLAQKIRNAGVPLVVMPPPSALGKRIQKASTSGHRWVLILGETERETGTVICKDLVSGHQETLLQNELREALEKIRSCPSS
jgi:histidyl-tRNA synthetase